MKTALLPRLMKIWLYVVLVVLALPLLAMTALSLNQSRYGTFPFHFTFGWYANLAHDQALVDALLTSLNLATQATIFAVIVGTTTAARWSWPPPKRRAGCCRSPSCATTRPSPSARRRC